MLLSLIFLACLVGSSLQFGAMGPVGTLNIKKIADCPGVDNKLKIQMVKDGKGRKAISAQLDLDEEYNDKWTFKMGINIKVGTVVRKNALSYEGSLCQYMNQIGPQIRKEVYQKAGIKSDCVIPVGKYNVKDVYATEKVVIAKAMPYGSFQINYVLRNAKKLQYACYIFDVDHTAK